MAKFNQKAVNSTKTVNHEGATAFKLDKALDLYAATVTSTLSNKFYESQDGRVSRIRDLIKTNDPAFVAKLAVYAREKMYMRSMPLVLAVELAKIHSGDSLVRKATSRVIARADEITELLSYYQIANERENTKKLDKLSAQIKRGLNDAFNKFNEYNFAKYDRAGEISLKDALFLIHPSPKDKDQYEIFKKIATDTLETPYTWEVELSALGQKKFESEAEKKKAFKAKWEELIDSKKVGYMAMLRNLRNILQAEVSTKHIGRVAAKIGNAEEVRNSKQFPFRFLSAYRELKKASCGFHTPVILSALENAMRESAANIAGFDENTNVFISCDVSGSMRSPISKKSTIMNIDIGLVLGMLLQNRCKSVISSIFGDSCKIINLPKDNILANTMTMHELSSQVGWSTNGYLAIRKLRQNGLKADKVMLFTDCQLWDSRYGDGDAMVKEWKQYKVFNPEAKLYLFDLAGYGNTPISTRDNGVYLIAGWSDKVFEILEAIENGNNAIKEINKIQL